MKIENRVTNTGLESNLVYPIDKGYFIIARLDNDWVKETLQIKFNVDRIHNKYAIVIESNAGSELIIYNHDGTHYLIEESKFVSPEDEDKP